MALVVHNRITKYLQIKPSEKSFDNRFRSQRMNSAYYEMPKKWKSKEKKYETKGNFVINFNNLFKKNLYRSRTERFVLNNFNITLSTLILKKANYKKTIMNIKSRGIPCYNITYLLLWIFSYNSTYDNNIKRVVQLLKKKMW